MNPISTFLEKVKKIIGRDEVGKKNISLALKNIIGADVGMEKVTIKGKIAFIQASPLVRNEIVLKKANILNEINKIGGVGTITDIK